VAGDADVDALVALQHVPAEAPRVLRGAVGEEPEGLGRSVEGRDVVDVDPEVVVAGQQREAERDERPPADEQRAGAAGSDGPEEERFIELRAFHRAAVYRPDRGVTTGAFRGRADRAAEEGAVTPWASPARRGRRAHELRTAR
jgi:hypothetical protein